VYELAPLRPHKAFGNILHKKGGGIYNFYKNGSPVKGIIEPNHLY
jgi:hypothetical protein